MAESEKTVFRREWLKMVYRREAPAGIQWSLSKKHIPRAVDRNRLKRWGRENLRKQGLIPPPGRLRVALLPAGKDFYKTLRRGDFDRVFQKTAEQIAKSGK